MFKNLFLAVLLYLPMTANAHSPLDTSSPQSGETLNRPPAEITMFFKSSVKLIKVSLSALSEKRSKSPLGKVFGYHDSKPIALDTSPLMKIRKRHFISLPLLGSGKYLFAWRAMGRDGHVIKGELTFTIAGV